MNTKQENALKLIVAGTFAALVTGCAQVPMAPADDNIHAKAFPVPAEHTAGLFIYRDSFVGKALKKDIYVDGKCLGETADKVFFYTQVSGNSQHTVSTESEFSPNALTLMTEEGKNYYIRQYIKMGVFVGGAGIERVSDKEGQRVLSKPGVRLAVGGHCTIDPSVKADMGH